MIAEQLKETLWTELVFLPMALRNCQEAWVGLLAVGIGTLVYQLSKAAGGPSCPAAVIWLRPVIDVIGGPGRYHAAICIRVAGRILGPALFS